MFPRALSALTIALALSATSVQCFAQETNGDFSVRMKFFNPKTSRTEWIDVFDVAGRSLSCSEHPAHPGIPSYFRGAYPGDHGLVLEYDLRFECKYSGMASLLQEEQKYQLFLRNSPEGDAEFQRLRQDSGFSAVPIPEGYERIHFTIDISPDKAEQIREKEALIPTSLKG